MPSDGEAGPAADPPANCTLEHRLFRSFPGLLFRRAEAGDTPVMVTALGDRTAALPLAALQRELEIPYDSPDGQMLGLIAQSLEFVAGLQPGDPLPREVLDGGASWSPGANHRAVAEARLRLRLAAWLRPEAAGAVLDSTAVCGLADDPAMRQHVNAALEQAAHDLGLSGRAEVLEGLEKLADEFAYIEALREGLLGRACAMARRIETLHRAGRIDQKRLDMLARVRRLSGMALVRMSARFAEVDAISADVVQALRSIDSQRSLIRSSRDWDPILDAWDAGAALPEEALWQLIERTYQFLAPRYMPVQEWQATLSSRPGAAPIAARLGTVMTW